MEKIRLTEKSALVLEFLKSVDGPVTGAEIAEGTGLSSQGVHGILSRSLIKNGLAEKAESVTAPFVNKKGETVEKEYVTYVITDAGREFSAE